MTFTSLDYQNLLARTAKNNPKADTLGEPVEHEMKLHDDIMSYCMSRSPRWMFIRARPDKRSTIAVGSPDFVIFLPCGKVLCVECKSKTGKWSGEQLAWREEMRMLGHELHECRSFDQFLSLCPTKTNP